MSDTIPAANLNQNTPSYDALEAQIAKDAQEQNAAIEAAKKADDKEKFVYPKKTREEYQEDEELANKHVESEKEQEPEEVSEEKSEETEEKTEEKVETKDDDKKEPEPKAEEDDATSKRIARLAFEAREAKKALRQLQEENARLKGTKPPEEPDEEFTRRVREEAVKISAQNAFLERSNNVYQAGIKEFPDFAEKLSNFKEIGGLPDILIEAVLETDIPTKVFHYLGKNLDEAEHLLTMRPAQMGAAIGKMSANLNTPPPVVQPVIKPQSKAPPPIKPVIGSSKSEPTPEKMSIADFIKMEDDRERKKRYSRN